MATEAEMAAAIDKAEAIQLTEDALCSSIAEGVSLFDKLNFDEHVKNLRAGQASLLIRCVTAAARTRPAEDSPDG